MRKTLRIVVGLLASMLVFACLVRIAIPLIVPSVAERIASRQLGTDVTIQGLKLRLLRGRAGIHHISVAQPAGFTNAPPLLTITDAHVHVRWLQLFKHHILIPNIQIDALALHLVRNEQGRLNLPQRRTAHAAPGKIAPPPQTEHKPDPVDKTYAPLTLSHFSMPDILLTFTDLSTSPPIVLTATNVQVDAWALRFDPVAAAGNTNMPGRMSITGTLLQPGLPDGYLGLKVALGITSTNIPPAHAAMRIVGFDLRSLRGILPPGIATAIGGSNLDIMMDASVSENSLLVHNRLQTAGNMMRLTIRGTPQEPILDRSTALFNLFTRPGAMLTGTVSDVADAGMAAGRTVTATAGRAGGGLIQGIKNIGRGATRTVQSASERDLRGIRGSIVDMTYGTVTGVVDTVTGTAREAGTGLGETVSAAAGRSHIRKWKDSNKERWEQHWEAAQDFATSTPFPGNPPRPPTSSPKPSENPPASTHTADRPENKATEPVEAAE